MPLANYSIIFITQGSNAVLRIKGVSFVGIDCLLLDQLIQLEKN